tara:strand:- start:1217 stop:1474 length:258 start_codon:yes stop_codon:yes gene_type:complete
MLSLVIRALSLAAIINHTATDRTLTVAVNFYNGSKRCATPNAGIVHFVSMDALQHPAALVHHHMVATNALPVWITLFHSLSPSTL